MLTSHHSECDESFGDAMDTIAQTSPAPINSLQEFANLIECNNLIKNRAPPDPNKNEEATVSEENKV